MHWCSCCLACGARSILWYRPKYGQQIIYERNVYMFRWSKLKIVFAKDLKVDNTGDQRTEALPLPLSKSSGTSSAAVYISSWRVLFILPTPNRVRRQLLDNRYAFHCNNYLVFDGIRLGVFTDPKLLWIFWTLVRWICCLLFSLLFITKINCKSKNTKQSCYCHLSLTCSAPRFTSTVSFGAFAFVRSNALSTFAAGIIAGANCWKKHGTFIGD